MGRLPGSLVGVLAFLACASILLLLVRSAIGIFRQPAPIAKPFLTARETAMLLAIERVLPEHRIHAQVAMGALLQVPRLPGRRITPADRNSFSQKIVDFVVQDRATGVVVLLIEIDDATHMRDRDRARDAMTGRAGYRTIRISGSTKPTLASVRLALRPLLGAQPA